MRSAAAGSINEIASSKSCAAEITHQTARWPPLHARRGQFGLPRALTRTVHNTRCVITAARNATQRDATLCIYEPPTTFAVVVRRDNIDITQTPVINDVARS